MYTNMHINSPYLKRCHEFEREQIGAYGRAYREEREGEMVELYYNLKIQKKTQ